MNSTHFSLMSPGASNWPNLPRSQLAKQPGSSMQGSVPYGAELEGRRGYQSQPAHNWSTTEGDAHTNDTGGN